VSDRAYFDKRRYRAVKIMYDELGFEEKFVETKNKAVNEVQIERLWPYNMD
jgi:hypothetical protein